MKLINYRKTVFQIYNFGLKWNVHWFLLNTFEVVRMRSRLQWLQEINAFEKVFTFIYFPIGRNSVNQHDPQIILEKRLLINLKSSKFLFVFNSKIKLTNWYNINLDMNADTPIQCDRSSQTIQLHSSLYYSIKHSIFINWLHQLFRRCAQAAMEISVICGLIADILWSSLWNKWILLERNDRD